MPESAAVPQTFLFAPEIEQALVSLCFKAPERIATVKRELDPEVHILQEHLRHILAAIDLAYRELGSSDFASVIQVLREFGQLEACGGMDGVNSVFDQYRYGFASPQIEEAIFAHYIEMLKGYARGRQNEPPVPAYRFNRGDLYLAPNRIKTRDEQPDFIGEGKVAGRTYRARLWFFNQDGAETLSISLTPK